MIERFRKMSRAGKVIVLLLVIEIAPIVWTAAASVGFVKVMGGQISAYYTLGNPETYWQWWTYALAPDRPHAMLKWLVLSGLVPLGPIISVMLRTIVDYRRAARTRLFGETHPASRAEMIKGGLSVRRKL